MNELINKENELVISSFKLERNGLEAVGSPTFDQWLSCGKFIRNAQGAVHFWIGDWLNFGELKYGETYSQAVKETDYDIQTLMNDKYISSRVAISRRRDNLSFSHHAEVADLDPDEQNMLLDKASLECWDRNKFRQFVRIYKFKKIYPDSEIPIEEKINEKDFEAVTPFITLSVQLREALHNFKVEKIGDDAKDFLFSELKKTISFLVDLITNGKR